jgi:transcriptional regulator with XRE-family HTH domain
VEKPAFSDKLRNLMAELGINQVELASALDLNQSTISYWLSGRSKSDPAVCLMLAGISPNQDLADYFIEASGLSKTQISLIHELWAKSKPSSSSLDIPPQLHPMVRALIDLYGHKGSPLIEKFKSLLPEMLQADEFRHQENPREEKKQKKERRPA